MKRPPHANSLIVLSFMSAFGAPKSPTSTSFSGPQNSPQSAIKQDVTHSASPQHIAAPARDSPPPRTRTDRSNSLRPMSMVQTYQPPVMEVAQDTIPELQPIFTFLNSHANKLYQEGYFLKLNDLDSRAFTVSSWSPSLANTILQRAAPIPIDRGPNALLSSSAQSCHCGTPRPSMQQAKMEKSHPALSTLQMGPSKWYLLGFFFRTIYNC